MTYSKIINIETKLYNVNHNFQFNKPFKFRFLSKDNLDGIELNEPKLEQINNTDTGKNNWYQYHSNIDFTPLSKYKHLILQLYFEQIVNEDIKFSNSPNSSYFITNKNNWYDCSIYGSDCGIIVKNSLIDSFKPVQEVDSDLIYIIEGSAELFKFKYLKTGSSDSIITVSGRESNIVNHIAKFTLNAKNKKVTNEKGPKSVNPYSEFIDNKLFTTPSSGNIEIDSINRRIEMMKFQLKNYFIENDKQLDTLEENSSKFNNKVKSDIFQVNSEIKSLNSKVDSNIESVNSKFNSEIESLKLKVNSLIDKVGDSNLEELKDNRDYIKSEISRL